MNSDNVKIVYITGEGRSGTTLLDRILGTLPGVESLNEIYKVWKFGVLENRLCSCGKSFKECSFWSEVMDTAFENKLDINRILQLQDEVDKSRYFWQLYTGLSDSSFKSKLSEYSEYLQKLYTSIAKVTKNSVIIDSSKSPGRALVLNQIEGIDVYLIHVTRDVRACAYAWQKQKLNPATGKSMKQYSSFQTILSWSIRNPMMETLSYKMPYKRIRYEDFVMRPHQELQKLIEGIEPLSSKKLPFTNEKSIVLGSLHTIAGNPNRFSQGLTELN